MNNGIKWVVFDLGGVVIEISHKRFLETISKACECSEEALQPLMQRSALWDGIGVAEVTEKEFYKALIPYLPQGVSQQLLIESFNAILIAEYKLVRDLICELASSSVSVACLSNTNSIHWKHLLQHFPIMDQFAVKMPSHQLGLRKPDQAIFKKATGILAVKPEECLLIDDLEENIESATRCGWRTVHCTGEESVREGLKEVLGRSKFSEAEAGIGLRG